ncbi:MAG: hypothetical protein ACRD1T_06550, partial [Acidimicrobiia bacterium]
MKPDMIEPEVASAAEADEERILDLVRLVADRTKVIQPPRSWNGGGRGGNDVDCIIGGLDPLWPLRIPEPWKLCQSLQYRFSRYQW